MTNALNQKREELDFVRRRQKHTLRYAQHITEQVVHSDLKSVAERNKLTESEVETMLKQREHPIFVIRQFNTMAILREDYSRISLNVYPIELILT